MKIVLVFVLCIISLVSPLVAGEVIDGGATLTLGGSNTYTGSASVTGGTLTLGGSGSVNLNTGAGYYSGKVERISASGKVAQGSAHVNFSAQSEHVSGYFTLPGKAATGTSTVSEFGTGSVTSVTAGSEAAAGLTFNDKQISFKGRYHPDTGRGFIRQTWVDPQTQKTAYKPGTEKMPIRYLGGRLFGKLVDAKGATMSFHAHFAVSQPKTYLPIVAPTLPVVVTPITGGLLLNPTTGTTLFNPIIGSILIDPTTGE